MSFLGLILKNPFRSKARAALAIIGIGIGIATIVALGGITAGLTSSIDDTLHQGGADFSILSAKEDVAGTPYGTETLNESWLGIIANVSGVKKVESVYIATLQIEDSFGMVIGVPRNNSFDPATMDTSFIEGDYFKNRNEVVIGKLMAERLEKKLGDQITLNNKDFKIVGIFESGDPSQDTIMAPIEDVQEMSDDEGKVSMIYVFVNKGVDVDELTKRINNSYGENITTLTSITDLEMMAEALDMVNAASWGISLLAILIGGIGIINTMIMSVYERTREIGVLKAVGWRKSRILLMILGESLVLTISSAIIGSILGVLVISLAAAGGVLSGMTPIFTVETFIQGFSVAIIVGLIGGLYPAYRASRLPPTEALRYE